MTNSPYDGEHGMEFERTVLLNKLDRHLERTNNILRDIQVAGWASLLVLIVIAIRLWFYL